jgi:hypothetical protein
MAHTLNTQKCLSFVLRFDVSGWELCRALIGGRLLPCNHPPPRYVLFQARTESGSKLEVGLNVAIGGKEFRGQS